MKVVKNNDDKMKVFKSLSLFGWRLELIYQGSCYLLALELIKVKYNTFNISCYGIYYGVESCWLVGEDVSVYTPWTWRLTFMRPGKTTLVKQNYDHDKVHDAAWKWYHGEYIVK